MSRLLRIYQIACIAIAFAYLLWHSREPLRCNVGDPWSDANVLSSIHYVKHYGFLQTSFTDILDVGPLTVDSYRYIHYPPFSEIVYGAIGKFLGVSDIATFRLFALVWSGLAVWLLHQYARRMYSDNVALIAAMLFSTSLLWLMYADSIHQAPVMQATGFLALWGLVRAIETRRRLHYAAAIAGSLACYLTSYDYWFFLPAAVLVTIYVKLGNPFAPGNRRFVLMCAAGCLLGVLAKALAVIGAVGWHEFLADVHLQFLERSTSTYDRQFSSSIPTMVRRLTLLFTPLVWLTVASHAWRSLRAATFGDAIKTSAAWMLVTALGFFYVFSELAASQMLPSQVMLPFYAFGSAVLVDGLLRGAWWRRIAGLGWLAFAPIWAFAIMLSHPRSVLDRGDVAKVNAYFAANDRNDVVMSNLMSVGHIQAAFDRHYWASPAPKKAATACLDMLATFEVLGTDYVHAIIFTDPASRFIDKSLWGVAMPRRLWSLTGWPYFVRRKGNSVIREFDATVQAALAALDATKVMHLSTFDLYRVDRATTLALAERRVPPGPTHHIDFGSLDAARFELLGWGAPHLTEPEGVAASAISGYETCKAPRVEGRDNSCKTVLTKTGLEVKDLKSVYQAQLMVRIDQPCDLRVHVALARSGRIAVEVAGHVEEQPVLGREATLVIPASAIHPGAMVLTLRTLLPPQMTAEVVSLDLEPACI